MSRLIQFLIGCRHHRQTRPVRVDGVDVVTCLDCGTREPYTLIAFPRDHPNLRPNREVTGLERMVWAEDQAIEAALAELEGL